MEISIQSEKVPVWELSNVTLPDLDVPALYNNSTEKLLPMSQKREPMDLVEGNDNHLKFQTEWLKHCDTIQTFLKDGSAYKECVELQPMWPNGFARFDWPRHLSCIQIMHDRDGFNMGSHIDNRTVVGVVIINLQDNPIGSGTSFHRYTDPHNVEDSWYQGPTKKGTGVFFLNNWNTWHSVNNSGGGDRLIAYNIIPLSNMFQLN
tara:strand:+ start:919 stop:1533 length:615 start_codon:yes stop_codon:yes gene_type:complete